MYLCVLCYCDTCLMSSALRVEVEDFTQYTMSTGRPSINSGTIYFQDASLDMLVDTTQACN